MEQLKQLASTQGYAGTKNKGGTITAPVQYKGIALGDLIAAAGGIKDTQSVKVIASDGYTKTFSYEQINGSGFTFYDLEGNTASLSAIPKLLLAYEMNNQALEEGVGPLELIILTGEDHLTDSFNFAKMVASIEIVAAS